MLNNYYSTTSSPSNGGDVVLQTKHKQVGDWSTMVLSSEEREAEILFREAVHRRVSKSEACIRAADIARRSPIAGDYLVWLLKRHRVALLACQLTFEL